MGTMSSKFAIVCGMLSLLLSGCESLEKGKCKDDTDCKGQVKGLAACYKEPPDAEIGTCMTVKEARAAHEQYKRKMSGTCEDQDGDGVKAGDACDPPVDCDDSDPAVKPGAPEVCDIKDNNCNEVINDGLKNCVGTVLGGKRDPIVHFMTTMTAGVEVAPNGDVWVSDQHQIYRIDGQHEVHRVAGSNKPGTDDKTGKFARFDKPRGLAVGMDGTVYVTDCNNNCVRKISREGDKWKVSAYAGKCSAEADDTGLDQDGNWSEARFWCPIDITFDQDGSLLVADMLNSKIKRITKDRKVETVAGRGGHEDEDGYIVFGHSDGPAKKAEFNEPAGIAVAKDGTVYIADMKNNCIRSLSKGRVDTLAGKCVGGTDKGGYEDGPAGKARFRVPNSVDVTPDGAILVADTGNHCIRKIEGGKVTTVSGKPKSQGYYDGPVDEALYNTPQTIAVAKDGSFYVVDHGNYRVRHVVP